MIPTPTRQGLSQRMQRHLDALGFGTVGAYRVWCHRQVLGTGLDKGEEELQEELARRGDRGPPPKPDYRPANVRMITRAYQGDRTVHWIWYEPFDAAADQEERDGL
ncbi:MAG: hypothetical protein AB1505_36970 [Candidatus Latescibacterota bacterium]